MKVSGGIQDNAWYSQIMFDRDGVLWGVTDTDGIHRLRDGTWLAYAGFPGNTVAGLCQSPDGVYWFSCMDGLYSSTDLRELKKYDVIKDNRDNVYDIGLTHVTPDETCWIGALTGVGRRTATGEGSYFKRGDKTPDDETVCITGEPGGAVWIGTQNLWSMTEGSGASRYENGAWTAYTADQGLASNAVLDIDVASDGVIWFGTLGGLSKYVRT